MRRLAVGLAAILALLAVWPAAAGAAEAAPLAPGFKVEARGALLMDPLSGQVLWQQDPDAVVPPASLTKLATLLVAEEAIRDGKIKLSDVVTVGKDAWAQNFPDSSLMFLDVGDKVTVEELLKGIAIVSGNDACVALADYVSGSVPAFVAQMNKRVQELGLKRTVFVDPHGLSPQNHTTAAEMAILSAAYIQAFPDSLRTLHSLIDFQYGHPKPIPQKNRNTLLGHVEGADGLKTGFIDEAGYNLVGTARRGDTRLLLVLLGTKSEPERERQGASLLEWGFSNFTSVAAVQAGTAYATVPVWKGAANQVSLVAPETVRVTVPKGQEQSLQLKVDGPKELIAPVKAGETLGQLVISAGGETIRSITLQAAQEVPRGSLWRRSIDTIRLLLRRLFGGSKS